jgi:hypothetical protein
MRPFAKILTNKYIRYPKYFLYGMVILWNFNYLFETDKDRQARIDYHQLLNKEAVPDKPSFQMVIPGYAWLFDSCGDTLGYIRHTMLYADEEPDSSGLVSGKLYFWIWAESVTRNLLACEETIRDQANAYPLGQLRKGTEISGLYLNDKKSWLLASCDVILKRKSLVSFSQYLKKNHWFDPKIYITSTNQLAGIALIPRSPLFSKDDFPSTLRLWLCIIVHIIILVLIYWFLKSRYKEKVRKKFLVRLGIILIGFISAYCLGLLV